MEKTTLAFAEKPDSVSWEDIRQSIWIAHAENRARGVHMRHSQMSATDIRDRIEGKGKMFVALEGSRVVGTAAVVPRYYKFWCGEGVYAYGCFMAVVPDYQGKGIYHQLCKMLEEYVRSCSYSWIMYDVHDKNHRMLSISLKSGYLPIGCQYWGDHYNLLVTKWLMGNQPSRFRCGIHYSLSKIKAWMHYVFLHTEDKKFIPQVVIIGQGYSGRLTLARSVKTLGYRIALVELVSYRKNSNCLEVRRQIDSYSKAVDRVLYCKSGDEQMMLNLLASLSINSNQKIVLIPDNDFSAAFVDTYQDLLKSHFLFPCIPGFPGEVNRLMDKSVQKKMAQSVGLSVPNYIVIDLSSDFHIIPYDVHFPCFVKPLASLMGRKWSIRRCDNADQLQKTLIFMYRNFGSIRVLVEDYMPIDKEYATVGFSDGKEVVIPGYIEMIVMGRGRHLGVAVQGRVLPPGQFSGIMEKFKQLVLMTGFKGLFDIDFYNSGGTLYFCELNLRFGGSGYAFTALGTNLPALFVSSLTGRMKAVSSNVISKESIFFNERVAMENWYEGYLSLKDYLRLRRSSQITFIEDTEDPCPGWVLRRTFFIWMIRRLFKRCFARKSEHFSE